jgi:hypothetical protein|nr:MAG TPA_asm: hypothetical protein [Caudoviricetes sp.]
MSKYLLPGDTGRWTLANRAKDLEEFKARYRKVLLDEGEADNEQ